MVHTQRCKLNVLLYKTKAATSLLIRFSYEIVHPLVVPPLLQPRLVSIDPRPLRAYAEPQAGVSPPRRSPLCTEAVLCLWGKKPLHAGVRTGCHYLICLSVCLSVCVCVTFVVLTDYESCTRPISTNPGSMEAVEYGLTRGTCFVARRLDLVAVAQLLWI